MTKKFSVIFVFMAIIMGLTCLTKIKSGIVYAETIDSQCKSAYLIEPHTHSIIYSKNENEKLPIASMCKIMTLLLAFEEIDSGNMSVDDSVVISDTAAGMGGSQVFLEANASYSVGELIKSIAVASANDASVAIAERICGSEDLFVDKMNSKAQELGMNNTVFVNCTGLPKAGQFSCAKDVSVMFSELLTYSGYYHYSKIWMDEVCHPNNRKTEISNTNKLIKFYEGCDGGKTGYTSEAGHCLAASAVRNGMRLVSVVISAPDSKTRFKDVSNMFNYGFANYTNKQIIDNRKPLDFSVEISGGKIDKVSVYAERPVYIFSRKDDKRSIEVEFKPNDLNKAPIYEGDILGKISLYENCKEIAIINVLSAENVAKKTYFDNLKDVVDDWAII